MEDREIDPHYINVFWGGYLKQWPDFKGIETATEKQYNYSNDTFIWNSDLTLKGLRPTTTAPARAPTTTIWNSDLTLKGLRPVLRAELVVLLWVVIWNSDLTLKGLRLLLRVKEPSHHFSGNLKQWPDFKGIETSVFENLDTLFGNLSETVTWL